ncbi:sigma-70 family RNA polymerase sigma factor [Synechococcus sp. Nb3U1]|uniref:sigma-70 family RNA polymerase sigma factor n=1 Tax=Synechococcus sp. Nb3U1 TaxID=1914529 RepID=UPI001F3D98CD|nr:sigma-70 family RNA polymerase sigma factor [Synechococcus sp. Nb3U1]MCF2972039.1 sigma-70 family RNA polymerase sigma factor [Synechococcus sp. Nb3U1]
MQTAKDTSNADDAELIQRCLSGDSQSFRQLYRKYQQSVRNILYPLCGADSLDDLVQEVFLRAWKGLPRFRGSAQFSTWLYRICWNVALDQRRRYARQRSETQELVLSGEAAHSGPDVMQLHHQQALQRGMAQLNPEQRLVLVLHDLEDLPQKEIAHILGIPVGTVKSRLFHARATIRKYLLQEGITP